MLFGLLGHTAFVGHASGGGSGDYFFVFYSVFYFSSSRNSPPSSPTELTGCHNGIK